MHERLKALGRASPCDQGKGRIGLGRRRPCLVVCGLSGKGRAGPFTDLSNPESGGDPGG